MRSIQLFALVLITTSAAVSMAAPNPGSSLSKLSAPKLGLYKSPYGFEMHAADTGWKAMEPPGKSKYIQAVYRDESSKSASLTVRVDELSKAVTLEKYVQKWQKEYPRFGFEMLGAKSFAQNGAKGFVLDLFNKTTQKQLRQVVFVDEKTAIILTCRDLKTQFNETLKSCNKIIKSFAWSKENAKKG